GVCGESLGDAWWANGPVPEGAPNRLEVFAAVAGRPVTLGLVREALGPPPATANGNGGVSVERIIAEVCQHYQLTRTEIASARRTARIALPRQLAMYLCREHTGAPLNRIRAELG